MNRVFEIVGQAEPMQWSQVIQPQDLIISPPQDLFTRHVLAPLAEVDLLLFILPGAAFLGFEPVNRQIPDANQSLDQVFF